MTMKMSKVYLNTPMEQPGYIQTNLSKILDKIIKEYNLEAIAKDGSI